MANNKTIYARFYKIKNGLIDSKFWNEVITDLSEELMNWNVVYWIDNRNRYVDVIFTAKPRNDLPEIFENEQILNDYDIWIRFSDQGGYHDIIAFKSISTNTNNKVRSKALEKWGYCLRNWNYARICFYRANQIELNFSHSNIEYPSKVISKWLGDIIIKEIKNNKWELRTDVMYLKSSHNHEISNHKIEIRDIYSNEFSKTNGQINSVINDFSLFNIQRDFLNKIYDFSIDKIKRRLDRNLNSIDLKFNDKTIDRIWWNEKENDWIEDIHCYWENCSDFEYLNYCKKMKY